MIPMVDLKKQYLELKREIETGIHEVLEDCQFVLGPNVRAFEKEAASYLGVPHAIGVASGTDALHIALDALGIGKGDEVITTPFTFIATAEAIHYVGAIPVFVDIDPKTFNLDIDLVEKAITSKTVAVMPVHLFGQPVDMAKLKAVCEPHGLKLIEDCAQSFGATIGGYQTGAIGDVGGFSFFPSKNLGCFGDGGLITTHSESVAERVKSLRNHGFSAQYRHDRIGYNSRLDEVQAVILRTKLKRIDAYNENRRRVGHLYSHLLSDVPVETPFEDRVGKHVYHQYTMLTEHRDTISKALREAEIASAVYYPIPLHKQDVFSSDYQGLSLPVAENIAGRCLSLPVFPELGEQQIHHIVDVIKSVF